jgi:ElaB/YqjD/DUF883 family membrane-anchored ribosome-binding protein
VKTEYIAAGSDSGGVPEAAEVPLIELLEQVALRTRAVVSDADRYLKSSPWQALALVAVAAVVTGYMAGRQTSWRH